MCDGVGANQLPAPLCLQGCILGIRLGPLDLCLGQRHLGGEGLTFDFVDHVAGLDDLALDEGHLTQEAGHAGAYLDLLQRLDPADEVNAGIHRLPGDRGNENRRRRASLLAGRGLFFVAGDEHDEDGAEGGNG